MKRPHGLDALASPSPAAASARPASRKTHQDPKPAARPLPQWPGQLDHGRMKRLLGYNLAQASIPSVKIFEKHIGVPFALRRLDFTILMLVASNDRVTQRQMSLALDIVAPRLTVVCDKLVERGLITRTRSDDDRRKQFISLTPEGALLVRKTDRIAETMENELLGHLSESERVQLFALLEKIATHRKP